MIATEWIFTLFTSIIPLEIADAYLANFIEFSWPYFYRFSLHLLRFNQKYLLKTKDLSEIISIIKNCQENTTSPSKIHTTKSWNILSSIALIKKLFDFKREPTNWLLLLENCKSEKIDVQYIEMLHKNYDLKNKRFVYPTK